MSLPICKNVCDQSSATAGSHAVSPIQNVNWVRYSAVKRKQLKGHHTIYKPAGRSHPHFALPHPLWAMIRQILIDDVLRAEALIGVSFRMVRDCIDGLSHVAVWLGLSAEDLAPSCSDKLNKVVLWMVFEGSTKIEVAAIKQLWQLK